MGLKCQNIDFKQLESDRYLRYDSKYHLFVSNTSWNIFNIENIDNCVTLNDILYESYDNFIFEDDKDYNGITTGQECIDVDGDIAAVQTVNADNCPNRLKYKIDSSNVLLSSIRLAKSPALNFKHLENIYEYVFSNGYHIYKTHEGWNERYVMYLLRLREIKEVINNSIYRGIGISAYKSSDLMRVIMPEVDCNVQLSVISKIECIENRIKKIKHCAEGDQNVINKIVTNTFQLNIEKLKEIDSNKFFQISSNSIDTQNLYLRSSSRWNKLQLIQKEMFSSIDDSTSLGELMINEGTKNGWSPECSEFDGSYKVLGIDAISKSGVLSLDNPKFTDQTRNNIDDFVIRKGDFFVSRGNTVDLVALASIAQEIDNDEEYIFPDLMIRIKVDETIIDKEYLAYIFNSIVGRMYFKYAAKGKQQSMVKVSSEELKQFRIPMIDIDKQRELVRKIKTEINKQDKKRVLIAKLRKEIDDIIYDTIK